MNLLTKYSGTKPLECGNKMKIFCAAVFLGCVDNRVLRILDCYGKETLFFKATLNVCVKGLCPPDCKIPTDYRAPNGHGDPYIELHGLVHNCQNFLEECTIAVHPPKGVSIEQFFCDLINCLNNNPVETESVESVPGGIVACISTVMQFCSPDLVSGTTLDYSSFVPQEIIDQPDNSIAYIMSNQGVLAEGEDYSVDGSVIEFTEAKDNCFVCVALNVKQNITL